MIRRRIQGTRKKPKKREKCRKMKLGSKDFKFEGRV